MKVKIKKLFAESIMPVYAKPGDAGLDLIAVSKEVIDNNDCGYVEYGTGLAIEIPDNHVGLLFPRSSISKTGLILANSVGVIDSKYRGEIKVRFKAIPDTLIYEVGEKVCQLIIIPYPEIELEEVEELSTTERNDGGFGSTGK